MRARAPGAGTTWFRPLMRASPTSAPVRSEPARPASKKQGGELVGDQQVTACEELVDTRVGAGQADIEENDAEAEVVTDVEAGFPVADREVADFDGVIVEVDRTAVLDGASEGPEEVIGVVPEGGGQVGRTSGVSDARRPPNQSNSPGTMTRRGSRPRGSALQQR